MTRAFALQLEERSRSWGKKARGRLARPVEQLKITAGVPGVAGLEATLRPHGPEHLANLKSLVIEGAQAALEEGHRGLVLLVDEIQDADLTRAACVHSLSPGRTCRPSNTSSRLASSPLDFPRPPKSSPPRPHSVSGSPIDTSNASPQTPHAWPSQSPPPIRACDGRRKPSTGSWTRPAAPYILQLYGDATWGAAGNPDRGAVLDLLHATRGHAQVEDDLQGLFRARWNKSTEAEQQFMTAMAAAEEAGTAERAVIAALLGRESRAVSMARASLIDKGFIIPAGRGRLEFTVPGFDAFVRKQQLGHVLQEDVLHRILVERQQHPREHSPGPPAPPEGPSR